MQTMIFHIPFPFDFESKAASGIRPIKMLNAFKEIGYEVIEISGYSVERKRKIKAAKNEINNGKKIDFVYSESSTMPTLLTDSHHLPLHPFMDFGFFKFCKKKNIPIGLFYRDIYWVFPQLYDKQIGKMKALFGKIFYRYDLRRYNKYLTILYLPSLKMGEYISLLSSPIKELLPASNVIAPVNEKVNTDSRSITLIYVGGIGPEYEVHELFKVMRKNRNINLIFCTRESDWLACKNEYIGEGLPENLQLMHSSGEGLSELYREADISLVFVKPQLCWDFSVPLKVFEYIGNDKPILATQGTYIGDFVIKNDIGWTVPYDADALNNFLVNITRDEIQQKKTNILNIAKFSRWINRAAKVVADMKE